jgi:hypothetical protein
MILIFDLDGVICTEEKTFERTLARPLPGVCEGMRLLRSQGNTIIIYTSRSWAEYRMTTEWLKRHAIEYDSLVMGKPIYDIWVDDRAIRFENWTSLIKKIESTQKVRSTSSQIIIYPSDEYLLCENRRIIFDFLHWLAGQELPEPILEVGPMVDGRNNPQSVLHRFPEFYVDTRTLFNSHGKSYQSLDVDPGVSPDHIGDVNRLDEIVEPGSIGTLIMLSVLEHMPKIWELPRQTYRVLKPGGWLCLQTPWNLRFHGPRPDCWRISDDGYHALFDQYFEFISFDRDETPERDLMPICFTAVLRKK